ncbi:30S ribosomal protein S4 [Candidatus Babeliales bacterium]|nr:30S ribosomal protein S4 [Candidatus Babeliales bacterium]
MASNLDISKNCRSCRKVGEKLFLKGAKCRTAKCPIEQGLPTPGQHGKKAGSKKLSEYGKQLQEKQKAKLMYGVLESQFRRFFEKASKFKGSTGENLVSLLERRLDNVLFRLKMAFSRDQARQLIVHGHINVNGKRVRTPSYLVKPGDAITLSQRALNKTVFIETIVDKRINIGIKVPDWLELDKKERKGVVLRLPVRSDVTIPVEERLIVELYSK